MLLRSAAFAAALTLTCAGLARAQPIADDVFHATTLNLAASGEVKVKPDMALLNVGITTEAATAQAAMSENAAKMNAVVAALKAKGVAEADIQTSGLSLNPQYRYGANQPPVRTGYQASNLVTVRVRALPRVGADLDAVVAAGANDVRGISFDVADRTEAENAAREAAVRALQAKAELYAHATGYKVLRLVNLAESEAAPIQPVPMARLAMTAARAESVPVSAGELTVRKTVNGLYELGR